MIRTVLLYSINCLFFSFFFFSLTLSLISCLLYTNANAKSPGHIFVYTYVRTPSATAARRSNVFLHHHQEGFCVINTRFQVKLPIGIRAWKNNKKQSRC